MSNSRPPIVVKDGVLDDVKRRHRLPTDEAVAVAVGVSRATYTRVKTGELAPSPVFMAGLVRLTGRTLGQLFEVRSEAAAATTAA